MKTITKTYKRGEHVLVKTLTQKWLRVKVLHFTYMGDKQVLIFQFAGHVIGGCVEVAENNIIKIANGQDEKTDVR